MPRIHPRRGALVAIAITAMAAPAAARAAEDPTALRVYDVKSAGATAAQAEQLAGALGVRGELLGEGGVLAFIDQDRFGALPTIQLPSGRPDEEGKETTAEAPDLDAIRKLRPISDAAARKVALTALKKAGLPVGGVGTISHSTFESADRSGKQTASVAVDTHVSFPTTLAGLPLIGPGAKSKFIFDASGAPTYVRYAQRQVSAGATTTLVTPAAADAEAKRRLTAATCPGAAPLTGIRLQRRLVYYAPALTKAGVTRLVPHYDYGAAATIGKERVQLERVLVPAVATGLAPQASIAIASNGSQVQARTTIKGGTAPYTYTYSSCAANLPERAARGGASIGYSVEARSGAPAPTSDQVSVTVTDANGLTAVATSKPVPITVGRSALRTLPLAKRAIAGRTDVGNEWIGNSQGLPNSASNSYDFRDEMSDVATIGFVWSENLVWESDFKAPALGGNDTVWADNADLVWFQGHGNPNGFATGTTQGDGFVSNTDAQWGDNDLEWLVVHSCSVLELGSGSTNVWNRWSPAFRGLHLLLGYGNSSYNVDGDGNEFGDDLADDDMRIRSAWVDANESEQPDGVIYRYMGVYGPNGEWNRDDYFHGIGPVTADITSKTGSWSYSGIV